MADYTVITDSGCDIASEKLKEWGVKCIDLVFRFQDEDCDHTNADLPVKQFYDLMRAGKVAKTSAANVDVFLTHFEPELQAGNDVLYLAFSSGLSGTVNNAEMAADDLRSKYPERTIQIVDTRCASAGHGLIVYYGMKKKAEGSSVDETADYVRSLVPHLCHWFTVDDLQYLKRGGRIDPRVAFIAGVLNIKPVLHMDDPGHLINMSKVRGRKAAIRALAAKYDELALDPENGIYFISNGDCIEDAKQLDSMLYEKYGHHADLIADIGPVIGAHSGPGTLALFFLGKHR